MTYHYETQCIPTPLAWFAHQLPVWWQKFSVVATFLIEIPVPFLFFSPIRRHRLTAFYMQVLLQVLIILSGNYNFFNLLTLALCFSLLDDEHINFLLRRTSADTRKPQSTLEKAWSWGCVCVELSVYILLAYWASLHFSLQMDWEKKEVLSKTAFTYHQFMALLKDVLIPSIWIGVLSLTWEIIRAMIKCVCMKGVLLRFWSTLQWGVMAAAAASMFAISLVPFTFLDYDANNALWPGVKRAFEVTDRYQLTNSYGLFRRMTGVGGRPEVIIEGSWDRDTWTEIEFMYKPGNMSAPPPFLTPHQPRLDWQMWFAALGPNHQSPWFSSLLYRLLQGKKDVIRLIQADESNYPFKDQPPTFLRAHRYKYWFTGPKEDGTYPTPWWRRVYVEEFYPTVQLGDSFLENMLSQGGLKEKAPARRTSKAALAQVLASVRETVCVLPAPVVIWSLFIAVAGACVLKQLLSHTHTPTHRHDEASERERHNARQQNSQTPPGHTQEKQTEEEEEEEEEEDRRGGGDVEEDTMKKDEEEENDEREEGMEERSDEEEEGEEKANGEKRAEEREEEEEEEKMNRGGEKRAEEGEEETSEEEKGNGGGD